MTVRADASQPFVAGAYFDTGLSTVAVEVKSRPDGTVVLARTTTGVAEVSSTEEGPLGIYDKSFPGLDADEYWLLWDDGAGHTQEEELIVVAGNTPVGVIVGADSGVITLDGQTVVTQIGRKRNDTIPIYEFKLRRKSGAIPPMTDDDEVFLNRRPVADKPRYLASADLQHFAMEIVNAADAHVKYVPVISDVNEDADFSIEVEVTYDAGGTESFPGDGFILEKVTPDLDPGTNP